MNSKETLTCNLCHLPQDIFRIIFQYLSVYDLMDGEKAFLNNQELLSLYRSSLQGFTLKEKIRITGQSSKELIHWIIDRKLLVEMLYFLSLRDISMNLLNRFHSSLKSVYYLYIYSDPNNSIPVISSLGHFPILTSVTFYDSNYFTKDQLLTFFSHNPQLEIVKIKKMHHQLSNEIIPHLSNYCPKIKILSLSNNNWVNDETISLLTQQRLFPNLKSLDIEETRVRNEESIRHFILSHPLLCGLYLPDKTRYSNDFQLFYLRQLIFPSILNRSNNNDLESHSLAISCLCDFLSGRISNRRNDVVTPEIFSVDILSLLYHKGCSLETLNNLTQIVFHLSNFPSMIDSILQSQFIPLIINSMSPGGLLPSGDFVDILFNCGVFHDYFPLLVQKYRSHTSPLVQIFYRAIRDRFYILTTEELQTMTPIVLNKLPNDDFTSNCLKIISKLLQEPSSQLLIDPNDLLSSFKLLKILPSYTDQSVIDCLKRFISVNENYQQLFIESNLLPRIMKLVDPSHFITFANHLTSEYGLLVDHLVDSGLFQYLLSKYSEFSSFKKYEMESLFKLLIKFNNNKYSEMVSEMKLPIELRVKLFEVGEVRS